MRQLGAWFLLLVAGAVLGQRGGGRARGRGGGQLGEACEGLFINHELSNLALQQFYLDISTWHCREDDMHYELPPDPAQRGGLLRGAAAVRARAEAAAVGPQQGQGVLRAPLRLQNQG